MEQSSGIYITEMSAFPHPYCDPSTRNGSFFENEVLKVVHSLMYRLWLRIILSLSKVSSPRKPSLIVQGNNDLNFPCIIFLPKTVKNNVVEILASLYPLKETKKNWGGEGKQRIFTEHQLCAKQGVWFSRYHAEQNRHGFPILTDLQSSRKENQQLILNNYFKYTKGTE